ncbi:hypothetical protein ZWY2020_016853 [Hordeum vulgare]|nr:hypothetical protein ZWY2020_016853 [Hordeum vulgare]
MEPTSSSAMARQTWELENNILAAAFDPDAMDAIYRYDEAANARAHQEKPWATDPHHFRRARISALTLLKMVVHAMHHRDDGPHGGQVRRLHHRHGRLGSRRGHGDQVNPVPTPSQYMVEYSTINKYGLAPNPSATTAGRLENVVGWYHSHIVYGSWLSGIDVSTHMLNKQFQEPLLAVAIDPTRTVFAGKVDIGAFRTYPKDYKPPDEPVSEYQTIPLNKIEDFGVHCKKYYSLDITYFKSSLDSHLLDLLWNNYWVNKLSSSPLLGNTDYVVGQIFDFADKLKQAEGQLARSQFGMLMPSQRKKEQRDRKSQQEEQEHGFELRNDFFWSGVLRNSSSSSSSSKVTAVVPAAKWPNPSCSKGRA